MGERTVSNESAPTLASEIQAWPAYALVVIVLAAAVYAFAPRPLPPFPATQVFPERLLINGLAQTGSRLVAVGEQGRILIADSATAAWREATVQPQRGSTLTTVQVAGEILFAGGHDGWILRSEDQGASWKEAAFDTEHPEPVMSIAGPYQGKMFAVGGFGTYLTSVDLGKTWQRETVNEDVVATAEPKAVVPSADEDPFAAFAATKESGIADRHLNGITAAPDGSLILVGERGLLARSMDQGLSWKQFPSIYTGSFFGVLALPPQGLLVYGMRGNAFYSQDLGQTWNQSAIPEGMSLFGGAVNADGSVVLAGEASTVLISKDQGATFRIVSSGERLRFATIVPVEGGWLAAGEGGLRSVKATATTEAHP